MVGVSKGIMKEGKCAKLSANGRGPMFNSIGSDNSISGKFLTCYGE